MSANKHSTGNRTSSEDSAGGLLSRLLEDATALVRNEIALARCELQDALGNLKTAAAATGLGAAVLFVGLLTLVAAGVLALALVMQPWLAALLVGVLLTVIGAVMLVGGKRALAAPSARLDHTQKALRADAAVVARRT